MWLGFAVLAFGGVEFWSRGILEGGALLWALAALWRPWKEASLRRSSVVTMGLALVVMGAVQLSSGGAVSLDRQATVDALVLYGAAGLYFFLALHRLQTPQALRRVLWGLLILGFGLAFLGIAQKFSGTDKIYWMRSVDLKRPVRFFGPFVNADHFASVMGMTLPLGWAAWSHEKGSLKVFGIVLWLFMGCALWMSGSRAGALTALAGLGWMALWRVRGSRLGLAWKISGSFAILLAMAALAWAWMNKEVLPLGTFQDVGSIRWRLRIWEVAGRMFWNHPAFGVGLGAFAGQFPVHQTTGFPFSVAHVHNEYLEWLAEAGLVGFGLVAAPLFVWFWKMGRLLSVRRDAFFRDVGAAGLAALAGIASHSFVEFSLRIPGVLFLCLLVMAVTQNALEIPSAQKGSPGRWRWIRAVARLPVTAHWAVRSGGTGAIAAALIFCVLQPGFAAYLEKETRHWPLSRRPKVLERSVSLQPTAPFYRDALAACYHSLADSRPLEARDWLQKAASQYREAIRLNPYTAASWEGLAGVYTDLGKTSAAIGAYQQALELASQDPFLHRRFAEWSLHRLLDSPALADRYRLADKAGQSFRQSCRLHPVAGRAAMVRFARQEEAGPWLERWISQDPILLGAWASVLKDEGRAKEAVATYREAVRLSEALLQENPQDALLHFQRGDYLFYGLGERTRGIEAARKAVELAPSNASYHFYLGQMLYWNHAYREAASELSAVCQVAPDDPAPRQWLRRAQEAMKAETRALAKEQVRGGVL